MRFKIRKPAWLKKPVWLTPPVADFIITLLGLTLTSIGAGQVYGPARWIVAGVGLFYIGAWHR